MKLIDQSMHWKWKASLVASITWILPMLSYAYSPYAVHGWGGPVGAHFETELLTLAIVPLAIWIAARWSLLKPEE